MLDLQLLLDSSEDADLVSRLKRRELGALGELYNRFGKAVFHVIRNAVEDRTTAGDLTVEVFVKAWNLAKMLPSGPITLAPWMLILARNHVIEYLRAGYSRSSGSVEENALQRPALFARASGQGFSMQAIRSMRDALLHASEDEAKPLKLAWYEGLSLSQISSRMNKRVESVRAAMLVTLETLRANQQTGAEL